MAVMTRWTPDPTFYPSPRDAAGAPAEQLAYIAAFDRSAGQPDAIAVVDTDPASATYGALGGGSSDGPGGIAVLDHTTFEVRGAWDSDRGDQYLAYDFWWHLTRDVLVSSEWGTPSMIEDGLVPELLLGRKYGHRLHFWDLAKRTLVQTVDLGDQYQMTLELRPAHDPTKEYGFVGVVTSVEDLSASIWVWHRREEQPSVRSRVVAGW